MTEESKKRKREDDITPSPPQKKQKIDQGKTIYLILHSCQKYFYWN